MAQNNVSRMFEFVQGREKARLEGRARKNASPGAHAPLSAEERARIARDLRFPNAGGLNDRAGSPVARTSNQHTRRPADNDLAATLPQRGRRIRSTFDSEYSESESSVSDLKGHGDLNVPRREIYSGQGGTSQSIEDAGAAHYGRSDALDGDAPSEDERPQSRASDFSRIDRQAQKILEENRARRLQTAAMSRQDDDSYPATTSGRISTPEPFADPTRVYQSSPRPLQAATGLHGQGDNPEPGDDSFDAHRTAYMRQSAANYQQQHTDLGTGPAVLRRAEQQPVRTTVVHRLINENKELPNVPVFQSRVAAQTLNADDQLMGTAVDDEALLDYEPQVLYKMTFKTLQSESFDFDPRGSGSDDLTAAGDDASLSSRLTAAMDLDATARRDLLRVIPQSDWNAVDAWFNEQFAHLAQQRTQKRIERRAIAREFEEQVAQRFGEVDAEREGLEAALEDMKLSGANVLKVGTPTPKQKRAVA